MPRAPYIVSDHSIQLLGSAHLDGVDDGTRVLVLVSGDGVTSLLAERLPGYRQLLCWPF
jgi:hypothetical protein